MNMFSIVILQSAAALLLSLAQPSGDTIPDFSHVGYMHGDEPIPEVPVAVTIEAPADGSDATELIQSAIRSVKGSGAVLLKAGTYNVGASLSILNSGVVLRGEGPSTKIVATARKQYALIRIGEKRERKLDMENAVDITPAYTPVGQMWVQVASAKKFSVGQRVCIFRPGTEEWIHDIRMDRIPLTGRTSNVKQWRPSEYNLRWERGIVKIDGKRIWLDSPVVMALDKKYGGGQLVPCDTDRVTDCGVENMLLESVFDDSLKDKQGRWIDENHAWEAVKIQAAENCWVRGVTSRHFGYCVVHLSGLSRLCTVENCHVEMPVSIVTGSRRYGLCMSGCEMCIFKDCSVDNDRHGCVTGARTCGPNVFLRCKGTNMWSDFGPHHRWATGALYDNIVTDGALNVQDRENWGSGHGWAGANFVLWNCEAGGLVCQNPWTSAFNWCLGCIGQITDYKKGDTVFHNSSRSHSDGQQRPDAIFHSLGTHVQPVSLYEWQLAQRKGRNRLPSESE